MCEPKNIHNLLNKGMEKSCEFIHISVAKCIKGNIFFINKSNKTKIKKTIVRSVTLEYRE